MSSHRLPTNVVPTHYEIDLAPSIADASFTGTVSVSLDVREATDHIVLNAAELDVHNVSLDGRDVAFALDASAEQLRVDAQDAIPLGEHELRVDFTGILNDKLRGFYRSTFTDDEGNEHTIATTQFESTDARRCFPCFDEPAFKATYRPHLTVEPHHLAIANTAETGRETLEDGNVRVSFAPTMIMSTYLVAFVVGPMEATEPRSMGGIDVRVVHPPGKGHLTDYALEVTEHSLDWFSDYYGIAYPGDKLDLVAIPDFAFGAMENLGCVTFREILVLVDPDEATQSELERLATVVSHELAHMWFGDLVTMKWWNGIWLNEAFATFMEMKATEAFRPEWDTWTGFGISRSAAMEVDSLTSTRPIEYPVETPAEAEGMFDLLTYEKGAAVVRMLEQYLGEDVFRDGVRHYLDRHAYGSTETHDLWTALEEVSDSPVRSIMDSWIFQEGYPTVAIDRSDGRIQLRQERFTYLPDDASVETRWQVPITIRFDGGATNVLLEGSEAEIDDPGGPLESGNVGGTGFYRIAWTDESASRAVAGDLSRLADIERYGLLDDLWASCLRGTIGIGSYLDALAPIGFDDNLALWRLIAGSLATIDHAVPEANRAGFEAFASRLVGPAVERLGWEPNPGEATLTSQTRSTVLALAGTTASERAAIDHATSLFADGIDLDPAVETAVAAIVAAHGDADTFDEFRRRVADAATPQIEQRYLRLLPSFPGPNEMATLLDASITDEIRTQDAPFLLAGALRNRRSGPMVWEFIENNWTTINERFPSGSIARMLEGVPMLLEPGTADRVHAFLADNPVPQGSKMIDQHLERLRVNVQFAQRIEIDLDRHLGTTTGS